jgi:phosphoserine aminotransferase
MASNINTSAMIAVKDALEVLFFMLQQGRGQVLSQRCHVQSEYMLMSDLGEVLKFHWNRVEFQQTAGHY